MARIRAVGLESAEPRKVRSNEGGLRIAGAGLTLRRIHQPCPLWGVEEALCRTVMSPGCATTQEYAGFAQAGLSYAAAVDRLLVASRATTIHATSNRLLRDDALSNLTLAQDHT